MKNSSELKGRQLDFQYLRTLEYLPKSSVDFFEAIYKANLKAKDHLAKEKIYSPLDKKSAYEKLANGFPLIHFDQMTVRIEPLRAHLKEICDILIKHEESKPGQVGIFSQAEEYKSLDLKELINQTLSSHSNYLERVSEKIKVEINTLKFIGITLAKPFFELVAGELKDLLNEYSWWQNYCPGCGSDPFMAKIQREDGTRILQCSLCATEWKFDRVKCPFCNNNDQKSLKFFYYRHEDPYRLYVCDQCKRYIKCIDERKIAKTRKVDLYFEDMVALYLDTLAKEKGYLSSSVFK